MATDKQAFSLRLSDDIREKVRVLATRDRRSITMEIEVILAKFIAEYEAEYGEIKAAEG
jgi:predicted transcriptional regulator